jgi:hypothetical protein
MASVLFSALLVHEMHHPHSYVIKICLCEGERPGFLNSNTCAGNPLVSRVGREAAGHASEQRGSGVHGLSGQRPQFHNQTKLRVLVN